MAKEPIADSSSDGNPKLEQFDPAISEVETQGKGHVPGALSYHSLIAGAATHVAWYSGTHVLYQEESGFSSLCGRSAAVCVSPWLLLCIRVHHMHAASVMRCCGCGIAVCTSAPDACRKHDKLLRMRAQAMRICDRCVGVKSC